MRERRLLLAMATAALLSASRIEAAPPENADPALAPWFQSLLQPRTGVSCCSISDCRPADSRVRDGRYEVFIDDRWMPVPPEKVLERKDNPTGRPIVCYTPQAGIMCFVRGIET